VAILPADISPGLQREALLTAANWHARLCSGDADNKDEQALQHWLDDDVLNQWAWSRVDQLQKKLGLVPGSVAMATMDRTDSHYNASRRTIFKGLALFIGVGALGWTGSRIDPLSSLSLARWQADKVTATGEVKIFTLADGSILTLNTASAVDIRFSETERRVVLRQGEVMIETAKDIAQLDTGLSRPFIVETAQGQVRALGTRFSVREFDDQQSMQTQVNVYRHKVEITTRRGVQNIYAAGMAVCFDSNTISPMASLSQDDWVHNMLVVDNIRLDDFLVELNRYRTGLLHCDPTVAHYRISGVFKTNNTDQALQALVRSFPVSAVYRTRYWVSVVPV